MQRLIMDRAPSSTLRRSSVAAGMVPIREDALVKMRAGLTTPDEVLRQVYVKVDDLDEPIEQITKLETPPV